MLYPMSVMVLLTFVIALMTVAARLSSVKKGDIKAKYFKLMEGQEVPEVIVKTTRNFNNQFEVPVLFYVVCTLYISLNIESSVAIVLAWAFVSLRCVHSYVHLTYNNVLHRMSVFFLGFLCVIGLWVNLLVQKT